MTGTSPLLTFASESEWFGSERKGGAIMVRKLIATAVAVAAAVGLLSIATSASAAGGPAFKATFSGTAVFTDQTTVAFNGSGKATAMGRITNDGIVDVLGPDDSCSGGVASVNTEVLTSIDGDTLTISSQDVACPIAPGQYHGTGRWSVIAGTGRFAGATGEGFLDGYSDFNVGTFSITLTGIVTRAGS